MADHEQHTLSVKEQVALLPSTPGVYQFLNRAGEIIYVGKAKNLKKRVSSYFMESREHAPKIRMMVRQIAALRHIDVPTEQDALLLENSLIKTLQPRYNTMLKDDKTYPWIVVRNEPFPRVMSTRRLVRDGSQYFGPYSSVMVQKNMLDLIHGIYQLRTCSLNLSPEAIARGKYGVCLEYHIGNCKGPCAGRQSAEDYAAGIERIKKTLRGDLRSTREFLHRQMTEAAAELNFEAAAHFKNRLMLLENYESKSVIVSTTLRRVDVFSLLMDETDSTAYCNYVKVADGTVVNSFTVQLSVGAGADEKEVLSRAISDISEKLSGRLAREVIVPLLPEEGLFEEVKFTVPTRGDRLKLLEFSQRSARLYRLEKLKNLEIKNPEKHTDRLMESMRKALHMEVQPRHIECFDNSNLQGTYPVASCVVFRDGKPSRREYRHFNVKTVVGPDDFASMREIVGRRYGRLLAEGAELPDLIVVDGGQRTAQCRLRRPLRTGTGEPHRHHRSGQTHRRGLFPERPDALLPRPDGRTAESHHAPARRGAPFRHHVPPQQTLGRFRPYPARRDRGDRNQDSRPAAAPVPQRGPDTQGFGRGARRCGRNGESPQGLRLFPRRHPRSGQARRGRRSGRISDGKRRFRCLRHKSERPPQYVGLIAP